MHTNTQEVPARARTSAHACSHIALRCTTATNPDRNEKKRPVSDLQHAAADRGDLNQLDFDYVAVPNRASAFNFLHGGAWSATGFPAETACVCATRTSVSLLVSLFSHSGPKSLGSSLIFFSSLTCGYARASWCPQARRRSIAGATLPNRTCRTLLDPPRNEATVRDCCTIHGKYGR